MKVTDEKSRIRSWIRIRLSEVRIGNRTKMSLIQNIDQLVSFRFAIMWDPGLADVFLTSLVLLIRIRMDPH